MARRKGRFLPDRKIRILRSIETPDGEQVWSAVSTVYAMRIDKRGSASDADGVERYVKAVTYVVPRGLRFTAPDNDRVLTLGQAEMGTEPLGAEPSPPPTMARGAQATPGDAVQDLGIYSRPIFPITDVHEMPDRKRIEYVCQRESVEGTVYGD